MANAPRPTVRSLLLCEDVVADPANRNRLSLLRLVTNVFPLPGEKYPVIRPELCVFVQLTECRGHGRIWVEVKQDHDDRLLFRTRIRPVVFPDNPLSVHGLTFRMRQLVFPAPGLCWVQLWFDDSVLGRLPLTLK